MEHFVTYPPSHSQNIFTFDWMNHTGHILKQLRLFYGPGGMFEHDVNVVCDGGTVKCHQIILAIGSDYFADIFAEKPLDRTTTVAVVELPKISAKLFRYVYQFMLNGTINLPLAEANLFIKTGQELKVDGLMHFTKGLTTVDATGNTYRAVTISSNLAKIPLNLASTESVGSTQLVKIHKTGPSTSTSASVSNEFESTDKLKRDPQDTIAMDRCVDAETSSFKFVRTSTLLTENVTGVRSNDGDFNDVRPNDPPEQTEMIGGSEGSISSTMMTGIVETEKKERSESNNKENMKNDEFCEKTVEKESCDKDTEKKSCGMEVEKETCVKDAKKDLCEVDAEEESCEIEVEPDSCEMGTEKDSCENESENKSPDSKSKYDDGKKWIYPQHIDDKDRNTNANNKAVRVLGSHCQNRKKKHAFRPHLSTSKQSGKRGRRGSMEYRGRTNKVKQAKQIKIFCEDYNKPLQLSNLQNPQTKKCKVINSPEEVLGKKDCHFDDCWFSTTNLDDYRKHMECHDEEFLCSTCTRKFMLEDVRDLHEKDCKKSTLDNVCTSSEDSESSGEGLSSDED